MLKYQFVDNVVKHNVSNYECLAILILDSHEDVFYWTLLWKYFHRGPNSTAFVLCVL